MKPKIVPIIELPIVEQVRRSMLKTNLLPTIIGNVLGGVVTVLNYGVIHYEVERNPMMWILATGGLIYSATTVYDTARKAFKSPIKALSLLFVGGHHDVFNRWTVGHSNLVHHGHVATGGN